MGNNAQSTFAKRLDGEHLTIQDVSTFTGISTHRLSAHSKGKGTLTPEELARIESLLTRHQVVYAVWRSTAEAAARGFQVPSVTIPAERAAV